MAPTLTTYGHVDHDHHIVELSYATTERQFSMFIEMSCPTCGRVLKVGKEYVGKRGKCQCGQVIQIKEPPITAVVVVPSDSTFDAPINATAVPAQPDKVLPVQTVTPTATEKPKGFWS